MSSRPEVQYMEVPISTLTTNANSFITNKITSLFATTAHPFCTGATILATIVRAEGEIYTSADDVEHNADPETEVEGACVEVHVGFMYRGTRQEMDSAEFLDLEVTEGNVRIFTTEVGWEIEDEEEEEMMTCGEEQVDGGGVEDTLAEVEASLLTLAREAVASGRITEEMAERLLRGREEPEEGGEEFDELYDDDDRQ